MLRIFTFLLIYFPLLLLANDPDLTWSTFLGSDDFQAVDVETDPSDNLIVLGQGFQAGFPVFDPGNGAYFKGSPGSSEGVLAKFSADGERLWATYLGGNCADQVFDMAVTPDGDILVVGSGGACSFPLLDPGNGAYYDGTYSGNSEGFILRFSPTGVLKWGTYLGGSAKDGVTTITMAENGNFWVGGWTESSDFPTQWKAGAYNDGSLNNFRDWFVAKFDANGRQLYGSYYGGSIYESSEAPLDMGYNPVNGHVAFSGIMGNNTPLYNPGNGAYYNTNNSPGLLLEMDSTGARVWATKLGAGSVAFDAAGNLFLGATCDGVYLSIFPLLDPGGSSHYQTYPSANVNTVQYAAKFDLNHALQWGSMIYDSGIGTGTITSVNDVEIDLNQNLVIVGEGDGSFRQMGNGTGFFENHQGLRDGTLGIFSNAGVHQFGTFFGGGLGTDQFGSITVNSLNEYLMAGNTVSQACNAGNMPLFNPSNAYYDGIGYAGSSGGNLFISRFSANSGSGTADDCVENFLNGSLPVTWEGIHARRANHSDVLIAWTTSSEQNNHYFAVERSSDGTLFESVGHTMSQGNAQVTQSYRLLDEEVQPGNWYYRVRQVDLDGNTSLSDLVEIEIGTPALLSVASLPEGVRISGSSTIREATIYSLDGKDLGTFHVNALSFLVPTNRFPDGLYVVRVRTESGTDYLKAHL